MEPGSLGSRRSWAGQADKPNAVIRSHKTINCHFSNLWKPCVKSHWWKTCSFYLGSCLHSPRLNLASSVRSRRRRSPSPTPGRTLPSPARRCPAARCSQPGVCQRSSWMSRDPCRGGTAPQPSPSPCSASGGSPSAPRPRRTSCWSRAVEWPR